jgi:hypothetical protein
VIDDAMPERSALILTWTGLPDPLEEVMKLKPSVRPTTGAPAGSLRVPGDPRRREVGKLFPARPLAVD